MKYLLFVFILIYFAIIPSYADMPQIKSIQGQNKLKKLEKDFGGKIGVYALNTNNNQIISYHADERFPVQSTMKLMGVSALLKMGESNKKLLKAKINYQKNDLMFWHPVTGTHITDGMTLESMAEAAITYSDNSAMNLIMKKLGGPQFVTEFAHSIGNQSFNISHYEGDLNSNPTNNEDTSTPKDMATSLQKLIVGNILSSASREQLITWMRNNTVGYKRMRAGVPIGWVVADKTGSGDYGIANDIGIIWSPLCKPIVLAIYTIQKQQNAKKREDIVASITNIVFDEFGKNSSCFAELNT